MVFGFTFLTCLGPLAQFSAAQQPQVRQPPQIRIEAVFPAQVPRGQSTVVNVAFPGRDLVVQAAEISPSTGVTVSSLKPAAESQGISWWELTVDVASDAPPGNRSLVLVMPMGRTAPFTVTIPSHAPSISDLRIVSAQPNQPTLELQFAAADASADLGNLPYVWFTTGCGGLAEPLVGAVTGRVSAGIVRATVPNPRNRAGVAPANGKCDLHVRVTDSSGIESNTLKTTVEFKN